MAERLVTDTGSTPFGQASAVFNQQRTHRYLLTRRWGSAPAAVFVMLNPSTADAAVLDPTVRRCVSLARREGCGGVVVLNLFALRSTNPRALAGHPNPVGPHNDAFLRDHTRGAHLVVAAWGTHGQLGGRAEAVTRQLGADGVRLLCLGTTTAGYPRHPLYIRNDAPLQRYAPGPTAASDSVGTAARSA
jgi:hypothetical protein